MLRGADRGASPEAERTEREALKEEKLLECGTSGGKTLRSATT